MAQSGEVEILRNYQKPNEVDALRARVSRPRQFHMPIGTTRTLTRLSVTVCRGCC